MRWRSRLLAQRFEGIEHERPGRGRKPWIQHEEVLKVVQRTLQTKPEGAKHWSRRRMALSAGLSKSTVHRIWQRRGLKHHLTEAFKLSSDPDFEAKLVDVVGLNLDPPPDHSAE